MSYEGYYEYLCPTGHYWTQDVYDRSREVCPQCGAKPHAGHSVDETNGVEEGNPCTYPAERDCIGEDYIWHYDPMRGQYAAVAVVHELWKPREGSAWWLYNKEKRNV